MVRTQIFRPVLLLLVALLAPLGLSLVPRDGASVIVLAAGAAQAAEAVARADGTILERFGPFGLIARSERPGFARRLYDTGNVLVLDGAGRGGCLAQSIRS